MDKIQEEIIEEFAMFDDWLDKYDYLISLSDSLPVIAAEHKTDEYIIEGCQSRVWVDAHLEDGKICYSADSDAIIIKGMLALLIRAMGNRTPQEVVPHSAFTSPTASTRFWILTPAICRPSHRTLSAPR